MLDATASLSTLAMAPRTAACKLASSANMGLRRVIPFAASFMTGLGMGAEGASVLASAMESLEFVLLAAADGAKPEADVESKTVVRRAKDFMIWYQV